MTQEIEMIWKDAEAALQKTTSVEELENVRISFLGKKGTITQQLKTLGRLTPEERQVVAPALNQLKTKLLSSLQEKKEAFETASLNEKLKTESLDISLPAQPLDAGSLHPTRQVMHEVISIFGQMGFTVAEGPEVEEDTKNFDLLNIPSHHPARQMQDTFYLPDREDGQKMVLRTHTSPVQIRTMLTQEPPIQIIVPGRVYRSDYDMTHTPMFHQVEALMIGENINMGHLKGCLVSFLTAFFGINDLPVRFRPSYFPFTEPSAEVDIGCSRKDGTLKIGAGDDWMEILGCGMVHPNVLENCGIDAKRYQGFALGMGVERMAMLKYGIPDLRTFFEGDLNWHKHYGFNAFDAPSFLNGLAGGIGR